MANVIDKYEDTGNSDSRLHGRDMEGQLANTNESTAWQWANLPWMRAMIFGLAVFFFFATVMQLLRVQAYYEAAAPLDVALFEAVDVDALELSPDMRMEFERYRLMALLEAHVLNQRYHVAGASMLSRLWIRYLAFTTGTILALVGATFVLGKLREENSELDLDNSITKLTLSSTSPGIILAVLGVLLMMTAVLIHHNMNILDGPVYLTTSNVEGFEGNFSDSGGLGELMDLP